MSTDNKIWHLAEAFVADTLTNDEVAALDTKLAQDALFAEEFRECVSLLRSLNGDGRRMKFRSMVKEIQASASETDRKAARAIPLRKHYWRTATIAAGIALLTSLSTYWLVMHNNKKIASQYSLLRRDLEKYKNSQTQLINNIKKQQTPVTPARYTGTGFALTNDGYLVTNYHVIEGADSIYIQNKDGDYFKATVKIVNPATDVAILKVDHKNFRFGKNEVPYTFASGKRGLGSKVYTMGYPQDEVVYNEGYISSKNGFGGDSMQYMLELPANPGQSGAPVLDASGNIIAIITGKQTEAEGATYAVSSKALVQLVNSLTKDEKIHLPKNNKLDHLTHEQQIEKMEYYTCSIKVYKK